MQVTQLKHESRFVVHELFCHVRTHIAHAKSGCVVVMIRERNPPNSAVMIDELRQVTRNPR